MRFFTWFAGFLEEHTAQSSSRVVFYSFAAATIKYAFRESVDIEVLSALIIATMTAGGIKLAKDLKLVAKNASPAHTPAAVTPE